MDPRLCSTCSSPLAARKRSIYCSEDCRPTCEIEGCIRKCSGKVSKCSWHCHQVRTRGAASPRRKCLTCGDVINLGPGQHKYCSDGCRALCAFEGCGRPERSKGLCETHHMQKLRGGPLKALSWAQEWVCVVCGSDVEKGSGRRRHCSNRCQAIDSRLPGRPKSFTCAVCSTEVSLIVPLTKRGQFKRADSHLCDKCKPHGRYGMNARRLAQRDGTDCKICGDAVDMNAVKPDLFRASVDHIVPRAVGGTDDPTNLQLAHLWCNQVKNRRPDFSLMKGV